MLGMRPASRAVFLESNFFRGFLSVLGRRIVFPFALVTSKSNKFPHDRTLLGPKLRNHFRDDARADGSTAFANGEV
jgi:hypothetical protein